MPKRVQMTRHKPWRRDHPDAVIVARPTRWGNPYRAEVEVVVYKKRRRRVWSEDPLGLTANFNAWVKGDPKEIARHGQPPSHQEIRTHLRGRDLACWCPLDAPCHADVLIEIANQEEM